MPARIQPRSNVIPFAKPVPARAIPRAGLARLRTQASACRACPLWRHATATVFGEGDSHALAIVIGEQPGDQEDRSGHPFVGPAGQLLDRALLQAGLDRGSLYLTNVVKHFKFMRRGKRRLHQRANAEEQAACRIWLAAEWIRLRPPLAIALGAMAAQTLFGAAFRITAQRGSWFPLGPASHALATWHPSAILRATGRRREQQYAELVQDLDALAVSIRALRQGRAPA